jgi:pyruvate dehydrogenase (quinone)
MQTTQDLPPFDVAAYARQLGLEGIRVETPGEVGPAWERALGADGPVVLDVVTDPEVPPLPPHIRLEHAQGFARALLHGDPASARMVRQSVREKLKDLVTR